jgi:4-alpha-glucanotransferase
MPADALTDLARQAGIRASYIDQTRKRRRTGRETMRALLAAMGLPATESEAAEWLAEASARARLLPSYAVCTPGAAPRLGLEPDRTWCLRLEDGTEAEGRGPALPPLPLGLHSLDIGPDRVTLIVAPARLPLPARGWGAMLPLHALRPAASGGIGDYADLQTAGLALAQHGAGFLGLNPIHAGFPADPSGFSPYTPSHRRRLSALHVAVPGAATKGAALIDYAIEIPARMAALRAAYHAFIEAGGDPAFEAFRREEGAPLQRFATHQALSERLGPYWRDWPAALQDPDSPATHEAAAELAEDVAFHAWGQWKAHSQLEQANAAMRDAGMRHGLYLDLAVGTHPSGAETWEDRDSFAFGASLGAPPDAFSKDGQAWGLAPFNPRALIAAGFKPLAETIRTQLRHAGALRIDHILGFDRAFWVPETGAPGAYVTMPRAAMLAILRLEAARAGAPIVGEDLGNVPRGIRAALAQGGILGCQVMMFERTDSGFRAPYRYRPASMASFSTHDLPTWAGWRTGRDIAARETLDHIDADTAAAAYKAREQEVAAFDALTGPFGEVPDSSDAMHAALAQSGSALVQLQIENVLEIAAQPNLPGTVDSYPNWRQRLPLGPQDLARDPRLARAAAIMHRAGRG